RKATNARRGVSSATARRCLKRTTCSASVRAPSSSSSKSNDRPTAAASREDARWRTSVGAKLLLELRDAIVFEVDARRADAHRVEIFDESRLLAVGLAELV